MDILFENRFVRTKEILQEFYRHAYFKNPVILGGDLALVALLAVSLLLWGSHLPLAVAVVVPVVLAAQYWSYQRAVKAVMKRDDEITSGGDLEVTVTVTPEKLLNKDSTGAALELPYDKVRKVVQTKNLILLQSEAKFWYLLPKDTFTQGTAEDFLAFLKTKGVG